MRLKVNKKALHGKSSVLCGFLDRAAQSGPFLKGRGNNEAQLKAIENVDATKGGEKG